MGQFGRFSLLAAVTFSSLLVFQSGNSAAAAPPADLPEHANLIDASNPSNNYAVIAPVFISSTGATSYIRLFSGKGGAGETSTFTFSVVGGPSGRQYGADYSIAIPYMASVQFSIQDILAVTGATALNGGDTSYAVYLKSPDAQAGYQHVTFNSATSLFENGNNCHTSINEQMIASHNAMVITNLHMPTIPAYPSTVTIHNHSALPATYLLDVYAGGVATVTGATATVANTAGRLLCQLSRSVAPNASASIPFSSISSSPDCQVPDNQFYANIQLKKANGLPPDATVAHWVRVNAYGGDSNLDGVCAVNRIARPVVTATRTIDAIVTNASGNQGLLTVTIQPTATASAQPQNAALGIERPRASATATGTYTPATGAAVSLTGTYDTVTNAVRLTGTGYTFTGAVTTDSYSGSYLGPNNATGSYTAKSSGGRPDRALCGTFTGAANNGRAALFFYADGTISGAVTTADNERLSLSGRHGASFGVGNAAGKALSGWASNGATFQGSFNSDTSASGTAISSDQKPLTFSLSECPPPLTTFGVRG